jgi:hypothetical protein
LDPEDFGFLDADLQKYADPRIWIQGVKYQPKTAKKNTFLTPSVLDPDPVGSVSFGRIRIRKR